MVQTATRDLVVLDQWVRRVVDPAVERGSLAVAPAALPAIRVAGLMGQPGFRAAVHVHLTRATVPTRMAAVRGERCLDHPELRVAPVPRCAVSNPRSNDGFFLPQKPR